MLADRGTLRNGLPKAMAFVNGQREASPLLSASCHPRYTLHRLWLAQGQGAGHLYAADVGCRWSSLSGSLILNSTEQGPSQRFT